MFKVKSVPLLDGSYVVSTQFCSREGGTAYDHVEEKAGRILVVNADRRVGTMALEGSIDVAEDGA